MHMSIKKDRLEITELFMAKAGEDFNRCFYGTIKRLSDANGNKYCLGKINVNQGWVCARAGCQEELGKRLDELVLLVLDYGLHEDNGKSLSNAGTTFFLN